MADPNATAIKSSLKDFLAKSVLPFARIDVFEDDDSFLEKGILDSTAVLELVGHIESQFAFRVEADEITPDNLDSLNKVAAFIQRKTGRSS
jgi:acyl carrier protein